MTAKKTEIVNPGACTTALGAASAYAIDAQDTVKGLVSRIKALEAQQPWGTAKEYGGKFQDVYTAGAGGQGAQFVQDNVDGIFEHAKTGFKVANEAIAHSVELDVNAAGLFDIDPAVQADMASINKAAGAKVAQNLDPSAVIPNVQDGKPDTAVVTTATETTTVTPAK
jgi:hypothetical protein